MNKSIDSSKSKMNVALMRRVAEVLISYEPELFRGIDLDARGKIVTLRGRVVGDDKRKQAVELARTTVGVEGVVDKLTVIAKARPKVVVETMVTPEKKDSSLTRGLVFVGLLGIISSSLLSMMKRPDALDTTAPSAIEERNMSGIYPVEGALFVEGKPAVGAELIFHPVADFNEATCRAAAVVGPDGRFRIRTLDNRQGAPAGKFAVTVTWYKPVPPGEEMSPQDAGSRLPPRFLKAHTTPLRVDIRPKQAASAEATAVVELPPLHIGQRPNMRRT